MRKLRHSLPLVLTISLLLPGIGCKTWEPAWNQPLTATGAEVGELVDRAEKLASTADTRAQLVEATRFLEQALQRDPANYRALCRLAEYSCLLGAGYSERRRDRADHYFKAIRCSELAMATNSAFRDRVRAGESLGEAASALTLDEMDAMHFWVTGVSYYFKECLSPLRYPFNMSWMQRSTELLERMRELDPDWSSGAVHFAWGVFYLALPRFAGGDMEQSAICMERAVEVAPSSLLARWGRAKYFHVKVGDREGFKEDLEWVLAQDPRTAASPYPWNVYFQRDARQLLKRIDRIF